MKRITSQIHLVFAEGPGEILEKRLSRIGYQISRDVNIILFAAGVQHLSANIAIIQAEMPGMFDDEIVLSARKIRLAKPDMRLIFIYGSKKEKLILRLIELGIYDHRIQEEFDERDITHWIAQPMSFADAFSLIDDQHLIAQIQATTKTQSPNTTESIRPPVVQIRPQDNENKKESFISRIRKKDRKKEKNSNDVVKKEKKSLSFLPKSLFQKKRRDKEDDDEEFIPQSLNLIFDEPSNNLIETHAYDLEDTISENTSITNRELITNREPIGFMNNSELNDQVGPVPQGILEKRFTKHGLVVSFFSGAKGGTGKTTLAIALSGYLNKKNVRTALVDRDMTSYGASIYLFGEHIMFPKKSKILWGGMLYPGETVNERFLNAPVTILDFGPIRETKQDLFLLQHSDIIFLVTNNDKHSLQVIKNSLQALPVKNIKLLINRYIPGEGMDEWSVAKFLGLPVSVKIPYDLDSLEYAHGEKSNVIDIRGNMFLEGISLMEKMIQRHAQI
ncbi:MAG: hypothetical protein IMW92_14450 [Bacillales bacterium]|nr:hypothetical protein [Bacillales bacterium]